LIIAAAGAERAVQVALASDPYEKHLGIDAMPCIHGLVGSYCSFVSISTPRRRRIFHRRTEFHLASVLGAASEFPTLKYRASCATARHTINWSRLLFRNTSQVVFILARKQEHEIIGNIGLRNEKV
jgi:hypothetical protein